MGVLRSRVDPASPRVRADALAVQALVAELRSRTDVLTRRGAAGDEDDVARHVARGKLPVRERIDRLLDPGAAFLELSPLAATGLYGDECPGAGIVTGIGRVSGVDCAIIANDATVKGGTYYPMTVRKQLRAQELALADRLPCLYLVDSGGACLPLQAELFPDRDGFGRILWYAARLSEAGVPQVALIMGSCTAAGAFLPALCDETIIVRGTGSLFLAGPPLVKAISGEEVSAEELGGAAVHARRSGLADHEALDDDHALAIAREIVASGERQPPAPPWRRSAPEPPAVATPDPGDDRLAADDPTGLYGLIGAGPGDRLDAREIIARLVDGSRFHEVEAAHGEELVCGQARLAGFPVGILASHGSLTGTAAQKGARFVGLAGRRRIPLLFLQVSTGFAVGRGAEHGGIARDGAGLVAAVARARVPLFTVIVGGSYGAASYALAGRALGPRGLWTWPTARIAMMEGSQAAGVLSAVRAATLPGGAWSSIQEREAFERPILEQYEREGDPYHATARLWDDGVIDPAQTREVLAIAIAAALNAPIGEFGPGS